MVVTCIFLISSGGFMVYSHLFGSDQKPFPSKLHVIHFSFWGVNLIPHNEEKAHLKFYNLKLRSSISTKCFCVEYFLLFYMGKAPDNFTKFLPKRSAHRIFELSSSQYTPLLVLIRSAQVKMVLRRKRLFETNVPFTVTLVILWSVGLLQALFAYFGVIFSGWGWKGRIFLPKNIFWRPT